MEEERQDIGETNTSRQEGEERNKGQPDQTELIPAANYKQSVRDTFTDRESVGATFIRWRRYAKVQLYLRTVLQPPYAVLNTVHQSQLHQMFPESGSGQGDGGRGRAVGQQPFGTLVFVLRHHAPVRSGQDPTSAGSPSRTGYGQSAYTQPPLLPESRLGCGT